MGRRAGSGCDSEAGRAPSKRRPRVPRGSSPPRATASHRRGHSAVGCAATFCVLRWPRMHCCGWRAPMHPGLAFASARQPAITRGGLPRSIGFGSIVAGDGRGGATVAPATSRPAQWRFELLISAIAQPSDPSHLSGRGAGRLGATRHLALRVRRRGSPNSIEVRDADVTQGQNVRSSPTVMRLDVPPIGASSTT